MAARYRILRKIADGGMAEIFLATQHGAEGFERRVVLKRILAALLADPKFRNMMIDEAHVAMSLNHSNIVQVLDLGQAKGRYFLVLELVDGWDLNQLLARVRNAGVAVPPEVALYIIAEVCRALSYAHGQSRNGKPLGIVHRDVSPHNVLLSEQGEVKLTDFGIAKALGRREATGQGVIKGKLAFMSPEQASGGTLDARSDLFSVGTMLYLLFTGRRPFDAATDLETILRVQHCDFPPPTEVKPDLAPEVARIVEKAMKKEPADRYQSAEELLVDLESAQRSVFRPAGQTELKRWLAQLREKDGLPPISQCAPLPSAEDDAGEIELHDEDIVFDQAVSGDTLPPTSAAARSRTSASVQRAAEALRASLANPPHDTRVDQAQPPPPAPPPFEPPPRRRSWLRYLLVAGVAAAGVMFVRRKSAHDPVVTPPPTPTTTPPPPTPSTTSPPPASEPPPPPVPEVPPHVPDSAPVVTPEPPAVDAEAPADASPDTHPPTQEDEDEDEEALLERQEPDVEEKVIGEEAGTPVPPPKPVATKTTKPAPSPPPGRPAPAREVVSVRITSRPEGAVVRIGSRVLGRAPLNLRFNSGITYELAFVKKGYQTTKRRFTVTRRKGQQVSVTLKKKSAAPQKKKGFLQRLFGR